MAEAISLTRPGLSGPTAVSTKYALSLESDGTGRNLTDFLAHSEHAEEAQEIPRGLRALALAFATRLLGVPFGDARLILRVHAFVTLLHVTDPVGVVVTVELVLTIGGLNQLQAPQLAVLGKGAIERNHATTKRPALVDGAAIIGAQEMAAALALAHD